MGCTHLIHVIGKYKLICTMAHRPYITISPGNDFMVLSAGVDNAEEGEHGLGGVAGFAEETTVIIIRVRVVSRID